MRVIGWEKSEKLVQEISKQQGPRDVQGVTRSIIVKEGLKANEEESSKVGQPVKRNKRVIGSYNFLHCIITWIEIKGNI